MSEFQQRDDQLLGRVKREFRDLEVEDLKRGYLRSKTEGSCTCIFCGQKFEEGVIYPCGPRLLTAEKAAKEHVIQQHGGSFACLLSMDKQINGLTDVQKTILRCFYQGKETDEISDAMDITPATVRTHRHNLQRMKREAKILLALMEQLEREDRPPLPRQLSPWETDDTQEDSRWESGGEESSGFSQHFSGNSLHPFFIRHRLD